MENQKIQQLIRLASIADNNGDYKIADKIFEKLAAAPPPLRFRDMPKLLTVLILVKLLGSVNCVVEVLILRLFKMRSLFVSIVLFTF